MLAYSVHGQHVTVSDNEAYVEKPEELNVNTTTARYAYAEVVGIQQHVQNIRPIVVDDNDAEVAGPYVWVGWTNPSVAKDPEAVSYRRSRAKFLRPGVAASTGWPLHSGSKPGDGGPVDRVFLVGEYRGLPIVSEVFVTSLGGGEIVNSPVFRLTVK